MLQAATRRFFGVFLTPVTSTSGLLFERAPNSEPRLIQGFQATPGTLTGIWHLSHAPVGAHFDFDASQKHPEVPDCHQLVVREVGQVPVPLEVIACPDSDELADLQAAGFCLVDMQPDVCHQPELQEICQRLARKFNGRRRTSARLRAAPALSTGHSSERPTHMQMA